MKLVCSRESDLNVLNPLLTHLKELEIVFPSDQARSDDAKHLTREIAPLLKALQVCVRVWVVLL
jgi:hypothetical protein